MDPIEKKPLFHFLPGTPSLSIATPGCNFKCRFCQNHSISQVRDRASVYGDEYSAEDIADRAVREHIASLSYTYTEPTVFFEYAYDIGVSVRKHGIKNVFVSNGFMSRRAAEKSLDFLDAINCDLKSFSDTTYREIIGGKLQPVLDTIQFYNKNGVWVEVTTLVVTDMNDSDKELNDIASFLVSVDPGIPWHVSRFHPTHQMTDRGPTPIERIEKAVEIGRNAGLKYVYAGNVFGSEHEHTLCPNCGTIVIKRIGFSSDAGNLKNGTCTSCGETIEGVWKT